MRLLYVTKQLPFGSDEAFIYAELEHLQKRGHAVFVVPVKTGRIVHDKGRALLGTTLAQPLVSVEILFAFLAEIMRQPRRVIGSILRVLDWRSPWLSLKNIAVSPKGVWLARVLRMYMIDHMHVHWIAVPATLGMIASEISGVPFSITAHRYDIAQGNLISRKFSKSTFVRAIDNRGLSELQTHLKSGQRQPILVPMGVSVPEAPVNVRHGRLSPIRGVIGARFIAKKGHRTLIDAISLAKERGQLISVDCFGDGPLQLSLKTHVRELGLQDAVRFLGVVSHEALQFRLASGYYDFAVLPSVTASDGDKEGVPVFLMESMAVGLPVVATSNGGISDLVTQGTGIVVPERDADALASAITLLASDGTLRFQIAEEGRRAVIRNFSIEASMNRLEALMRQSSHQAAKDAPFLFRGGSGRRRS